MAQFDNYIFSNAVILIEQNGTPLAQRSILNFIGSWFTVTDNPGNLSTDVTFPAPVLITGSTMTGALILNADPVLPLGAATKQYVDSLSAGLSPRTSCRAGTTAALTVTYANGASGVGATLTNAGAQAALVLDGVTMAVNDRVLVKDQVSTFQNGIYVVTDIGSGATNWILTRATDYDTAAANEVVEGSYTIVSQGTVNATNMFVETGAGPFTIGTTPIVFSAFNSAAGISVGTGLTKVGNVISLTNPVLPSLGGTGVANLDANTITLGGAVVTAGAFTTSGANPLTLTTTGATNVTLPTTGTLVNTAVTTLSSLASIGTITTGVWNGNLISPIYGGTGINNGASTLTLGGSLTTSGAFTSTFTMTGNTSVTFPTSGTLATTAQLPTLPLSLTNGGTNASLVASNGGIFYSTATAGAILAGTATAGQILRSGSTAAPSWSTATYPDTTTVSQILYSSSANVIGGITTGNNGVLITSAGGVPSISSTLPSAVQTNITAVGALAAGSLATGFTPVTVPLGGTGNTTFTAYSVICAGTTATGTFQNVSGVGSANQVLVSNGAAALPTWQATPMPAGTILQVVQSTLTSTVTTTSNTFVTTGLSVSITPSSASSRILVLVSLCVGQASTGVPRFLLNNGVTSIFLGDVAGSRALVSGGNDSVSAVNVGSVSMHYVDSPATTSALTYEVRYCTTAAAAAIYLNRSSTDTNSADFPRGASSIIVMEIKG